MTSAAWVAMVTEEMMPRQALIGGGCAVALAFVMLFVWKRNRVAIADVVVLPVVTFIMMGILEIAGWTLGCNEVTIITVGAGICGILVFGNVEQPSPSFGRMQAAIVSVCTSMSVSLLAIWICCGWMYCSVIVLFYQFATFLIGGSFVAFLCGIAFVPALTVLISGREKTLEPKRMFPVEKVVEE
jgi:hypothetical protein